MKPWTERKQIRSAVANEHVAIGERTLPGGAVLRGLYAARDFAPGDYLASFHGSTVSREEVYGLHKTDRARFDQINEYAIGAPSGGHLVPEVDRMGAHLINHACAPNAKWAEWEQGVLLVRAVRPIALGEEVTVHYGWVGIKAAMEDRRHPCACAAPMCVGTIELYVEWIPNGENSGGPYLPPTEVSRRLLCDLMNDTDANEALLYGYAKGTKDLLRGSGAELVSSLDPDAFRQKISEGAEAAISLALALQARGAGQPSERRLRHLARTYGVLAGREEAARG